jgi:hypothetical protein
MGRPASIRNLLVKLARDAKSDKVRLEAIELIKRIDEATKGSNGAPKPPSAPKPRLDLSRLLKEAKERDTRREDFPVNP